MEFRHGGPRHCSKRCANSLVVQDGRHLGSDPEGVRPVEFCHGGPRHCSKRCASSLAV